MNLIDKISNHKQLQSIFPKGLSLDDLTLDVILFDAGPRILFRFIGCPITENSPEKWKEKKYDYFGFSLEFVCVSDVMVSGWRPLVKCSPEVFLDNGQYKLLIKSEDVNCSCVSDFLYLKDVNAYSSKGK